MKLFRLINGHIDRLLEFTDSLSIKKLHPDPASVRRTDYYTGLIFEAYLSRMTEPPLRGGQYDKLMEHYSGIDAAAAGFALDVSSIVRNRLIESE